MAQATEKINSEPQAGAKRVKRRFKISPRFILVLTIFALAFGAFIYMTQEQKLNEIHAQQAELEAKLEAAENEKQRIEYMIEYAKSEEYLLQYAREKLGYVRPDDIKFDIDYAK